MQILSKNIFEFKLSPTRVMALKEIFLIVKSWETRQAMALVKNNGWDYSASIEKETQFQCKTVRFQLLKRRINYLYKRKPCAVLSHSKQAIIWFVQWCVYQINNKALNCPVSNFQEKGKYNAFCLLVLFYTVEKNMVIITQLHYIGFHWLWTLDAPTLTSDSKNIISISTAMQILCSWCSVCINCFCFDLCKNVCFWKASSSLVRDLSLIAYANEIYLDH